MLKEIPVKRISSTNGHCHTEGSNSKSSLDIKNQMIKWFFDFAKRIDSKKIDEGMIPPFIINELGRNGFFGMGISKRYGGAELNVTHILEILEMIAAKDMSVGILILDSLLSAYTIGNYAHDSIKESYLPEMAQGRILSAVAITEDAAGSNPRAMETYAEMDEDGNWVLNGQKRWVGYASWAGFINVYAQTYVNGKPIGISGFFVPIDTDGLEIREEAETMGIKGFPKHTINLKEVKIPKENILGQEGKGMESAQHTFMFIRLCMGSLCLGSIKKLIQISTTYAYNRSIASGLLLDNPVSRITLTNLINGASALEVLLKVISDQLDNKIEVPEPAFIVTKTLAGELLSLTADKSMQMLGARGYEETNRVAQMYRDGRPFRIFEGPTEVLINYLGTQAYFENGEVYSLLENNFQNKEAANQLRSYVKKIKEKYKQDPVFDKNDANTWIYSVIGEITQWVILASVIEFDAKEELQSTKEWVDSKSEEVLNYYLQKTPEEKTLLTSKKIINTVKTYENTIGPFAPNCLGYKQHPDELVVRAIPDNILNQADRQKVLFDWNNNENVNQESLPNLLELLKKSLKDFAGNIAVSEKEKTITYAELDKLSDFIAFVLQEKGVVSGDLVGLACDCSIDMIVGIISILKLGAGYVPIDKSLPTQRCTTIIEETGLSFVLTQQTIKNLPLKESQQICIDEKLELVRKNPSLLKECPYEIKDYNSGNTAYVIFTSGSTGVPKGVAISHQAVANFSLSSVKKYQITENDRVLQFASLSFDTSVEEIFPTLISGGSLLLRTENMLDSFPDFLSECYQMDITILNLPTQFWANLAMDSFLQSNPDQLPENLRTVIVGGDKLNSKALKYWDQLDTNEIDLWDTYGPTETTVVAVSKLLRSPGFSELRNEKEILTIGRPDENVCVYVVDELMNPVPIGEKGELLIGGANLGRYLNRPELNKQKFIDNSFISDNGQSNNFNRKLYKTGDLVRYQPNGELLFEGRLDNQVKIRGFRVELEEIEKVLNNCPEVKEGVVLVHQKSEFKELLAAVIFQDNGKDKVQSLNSYLTKHLPNYMIPAHVVSLVNFPMTISKKIDREAVLKQVLNSLKGESSIIEATDINSQLINIWQQILGVSIYDSSNFFNEGGHSLSVMQVIGEINTVLNVSVSAREFFDNPTIKELTILIKERLNSEEKLNGSINSKTQIDSEYKKGPISETYGLSKAQIQYYLHDQLHASQPLYNEPFLLQSDQPIIKEELEQALLQLISRHELLRTSFHQSEQGFYQRVHEQVSFSVDYFDFSKYSLNEGEDMVFKESDASLGQLFDLETPCLMRCSLFKLGENDYRIFFVMHHLVIDGTSLYNIFLPELVLLLNGKVNELISLDCTSKYRNYVESNYSINSQTKSFWQNIIKKYKKLVLPCDYKTESSSVAGSQFISKIYSSEIKEIAQLLGVSKFNVACAALNILLRHYSQQETISLGTILNDRPFEMEKTIGIFSNTTLIQTVCNHQLSVKDYVFQVQNAFLDVLENVIPFEELVSIGRTGAVGDLIQAAIIYEPLYQKDHGFELDMHYVHSGTSKFDLLFRIEEQDDATTLLCVEYKTELFHADTIHRMVQHFENILALIKEDINQPIGKLDFRTTQEKQLLKSVDRDFLPLCCHELFEKQVAKTPGELAVSFEGVNYTYQELNKVSNQITHFLEENGVEKGNFVGVYLPRSIYQIATVIAILKAGAVLIPLDPSYPKKRLEYIVEQTEMNFLITDSKLPELKFDISSTIHLNKSLEIIASQKGDNLNKIISPDSLAYITYTSGSMGTPKGAQVSNQPLSNLIQWQVERSVLNNKTLQYTPLSFDVSFQEIFSTLSSGGTLVLISDEMRKNPVALIGFIRDNKVSRIFLPFVALDQLANAVHLDMAKVPQSLVEIITAGEQLKITKAIQSLFEQLPNSSLDNQYGPCETHVITAGKLKAENIKNWSLLPSIGKPIANSDFKILDKVGQPVAANTEGELYIGINCKNFGYLENEAETKNKFMKLEGKIYYRSGDIVRYDVHGNIYWLTRADNQIKIRGHRVETGEVESILLKNSAIEQAIVTAIEKNKERILVAYLKLGSEIFMEENKLNSFYEELQLKLQEQLPNYMIPVHFNKIVSFNLTPSGKINRKSLPVFDLTNTFSKQEGSDSNSEGSFHLSSIANLESEIIELFAQVLDLDRNAIGANANFFNLGGSSLNSFLLTSKISKNYKISIDPSLLMSHPTPALLAETLRASSGFTLSSLVEIRKEGDLPPLFLVPGSGGTLMPFEELINQILPVRPVYGFVHPRLRGNMVDCTTINDLAAFYIDCLDMEMISGTCYIAGHCFGGAVAYEMSQILALKGVNAIPVVIDTPVPQETTRNLPVNHWNYAQWIAIVGEILAENAGHKIRVMDEIIHMDENEAFLYLKNTLVKAGLFAADNDIQHLKTIVDMLKELDLSFINYQPEKSESTVYLLRAREMTALDKLGILASGHKHLHWGWQDIVDTINCKEVNGDHNTMLEKGNVGDVVQFLEECFLQNDPLLIM